MNTQQFKIYSVELLSEIMQHEHKITLLNESIDDYQSKIKKLSHKRQLINLYVQKIEQIDEDITLKDLLKGITYEIVLDKHTGSDNDLMLHTKVDNMRYIKTLI